MIILEDNSNERASGDKTLEAEGPEVLVPELPTVLPPPYTPQPPHADLLETQTLQTMLSHPGTSNSRPPSALWRFFKALGYALLIITLARMLVWGMNFPSHGRREHHKRRGSLVHQKSHGMERSSVLFTKPGCNVEITDPGCPPHPVSESPQRRYPPDSRSKPNSANNLD